MAYIYMPRTASKSLNAYFAKTWCAPLFGTASPAHHREIVKNASGPSFVTVAKGHENLSIALNLLYRHGRTIDQFQKLIFVVRNPYDLVYSNYKFLREEWARKAGGENAKMAAAVDFETFCGRVTHPDPKNWLLLDKALPENLHLLKFEELEASVRAMESSLDMSSALPIPHLNKSKSTEPAGRMMTKQAEQKIYDSYSLLFELGGYDRLTEVQ